jgi:hypothetical protein
VSRPAAWVANRQGCEVKEHLINPHCINFCLFETTEGNNIMQDMLQIERQGTKEMTRKFQFRHYHIAVLVGILGVSCGQSYNQQFLKAAFFAILALLINRYGQVNIGILYNFLGSTTNKRNINFILAFVFELVRLFMLLYSHVRTKFSYIICGAAPAAWLAKHSCRG